MSIVRSSKYRHIFSDPPKPDKCYNSVAISKGPWESNMSAVNAKFVAVALESRGGGSFVVLPIEKVLTVDKKIAQ